MTRKAVVRSRHMKLFLHCVDELQPPMRDAVRDAFAKDDVESVEQSTATDWLPIELNVRMTESLWKVLGPGPRERFFVRLGTADFESSLLNSLVAGAIGVFGVDPKKLLGWAPRGWSQIFRDSGELEVVDAGDHEIRLVWRNLAQPLARSTVWMESVRCSMRALLDVLDVKGTVDLEVADASARHMALLFAWKGR